MSNIIIDNSTLSAVQRITGDVSVPKNYSIEGDYSAYENFLSALLFYDNFYYIDDYKADYRVGRKRQFPFLRHVPPSLFPYAEVENQAVEVTEDLILDIRAGNLESSALTDFLDVMGLSLTAAWQMASSDFFLTLKVLSDNPDQDTERYKYSPLTSAIFNQLNERPMEHMDDAPLYLESNKGKEIPCEGFLKQNTSYSIERHIRDFSNSLNWLSRRATFYVLVSSHFDAAFCLHPIRHNFINSLAQEKQLFCQSKIWRENFRKFFGRSAQAAVNKVNMNVESTEIGIKLPLLAAWSVGKTGDAAKAIEAVLDLRTEPSAQKMRAYLSELDEARTDSSKKEINKLFAAVEVEKNKIITKYGMSMKEASNISIKASIAPEFGLSVSKSISLPDLGLIFGRAKYARGLFRNVVEDIANFPNLGLVRGKLLRKVKRDDDQREYVLRIEEKRFRHAKPYWKKPM